MHACMHACIHTYIHTYFLTYLLTCILTYMHTYIHTYVYYRYIYIYIYTYTYKCLRVVLYPMYLRIWVGPGYRKMCQSTFSWRIWRTPHGCIRGIPGFQYSHTDALFQTRSSFKEKISLMMCSCEPTVQLCRPSKLFFI